jgi:hypothetical protein
VIPTLVGNQPGDPRKTAALPMRALAFTAARAQTGIRWRVRPGRTESDAGCGGQMTSMRCAVIQMSIWSKRSFSVCL